MPFTAAATVSTQGSGSFTANVGSSGDWGRPGQTMTGLNISSVSPREKTVDGVTYKIVSFGATKANWDSSSGADCSENICTPKLTNTYVLKTDPYDQDQEVTMVSFTWYYNVSCNGTLNPCKRLTVHGCVNNSSNCYYSTTGTNVCKSGSWSSTAGFPAGTKFGDIYFEVRENGQRFTGE